MKIEREGSSIIYILEGPDGTGKTTLAREIYNQTKGHILHCTYKKGWDMEDYFDDILELARDLNEWQDVVIDRWAPSEHVYGEVFRGGPSFDVHKSIWENPFIMAGGVKFIYCRNENAVENHLKNKQGRIEMFETMEGVQEGFDKFVKDTEYLHWIHYDFNKVGKKKFVKELVKNDR